MRKQATSGYFAVAMDIENALDSTDENALYIRGDGQNCV